MTLPLTLILTLSLTRRAALEREGLAKLCHARAIAGPDSSAGVRNTNWEGFQSYHDVFRPASPNYCSELHNLVSASPPPPPHPHPHPHPTPPSPPPFPLTFTLTPTFTLTRCSPRSPGERRDARSRARSVPRCCSSCLFLNPSPDSRPQPSPSSQVQEKGVRYLEVTVLRYHTQAGSQQYALRLWKYVCVSGV